MLLWLLNYKGTKDPYTFERHACPNGCMAFSTIKRTEW